MRKLGEVTRYETKDYVGGARILDLDRASGRRRSSLPPAAVFGGVPSSSANQPLGQSSGQHSTGEGEEGA